MFQIAGAPPTCPADLSEKCADSDDWEGEFFPGIPNIKYEVKRLDCDWFWLILFKVG